MLSGSLPSYQPVLNLGYIMGFTLQLGGLLDDFGEPDEALCEILHRFVFMLLAFAAIMSIVTFWRFSTFLLPVAHRWSAGP